MTKEVTFRTGQESVEEAERRMGQARVRRLPVLGGEGQILGLVTVADLARQVASRSGGSWAPVLNAILAVTSSVSGSEDLIERR